MKKCSASSGLVDAERISDYELLCDLWNENTKLFLYVILDFVKTRIYLPNDYTTYQFYLLRYSPYWPSIF